MNTHTYILYIYGQTDCISVDSGVVCNCRPTFPVDDACVGSDEVGGYIIVIVAVKSGLFCSMGAGTHAHIHTHIYFYLTTHTHVLVHVYTQPKTHSSTQEKEGTAIELTFKNNLKN